MTIDDIHEELIRTNVDAPMTEDDALLWMALLHSHWIRFRSPLLADRPNIMCLAPITERHCADVMAALWRHRKRADRASSSYWYYKYSVEAGYQGLEDLPPEKLHRLEELREQLATDPRIEKIVPDN